jgi:hypothetical protein
MSERRKKSDIQIKEIEQKEIENEQRKKLIEQNERILIAVGVEAAKGEILQRMDKKIETMSLSVEELRGGIDSLRKIVDDHDYIIHGREGSPYQGLVPYVEDLRKDHNEHKEAMDNFVDVHEKLTVQEAGIVSGEKKGATKKRGNSEFTIKKWQILTALGGLGASIFFSILTLLARK